MCGIVGIMNMEGHALPAGSFLLEALKKLEYRGYDSSGIALAHAGKIICHKAVGKLAALVDRLQTQNMFLYEAVAGIGHTRWASHGSPTCANAHPHLAEGLAVIHNGIIENFQDIRAFLAQNNIFCTTETDTEVAGHLVAFYLQKTQDALSAVQEACRQLRGNFSLVFLFQDSQSLIGVQSGNPLIVGHTSQATLLASDVLAMSAHTHQFTFLEPGDTVMITPKDVTVYAGGKRVHRTMCQLDVHANMLPDKKGFPHFMLKEIYEQPEILSRCFAAYVHPATGTFRHDVWPPGLLANKPQRLLIVACGTSYYAGLIAKIWLTTFLEDVWVDVEVASEFRYQECWGKSFGSLAHTLAIFISQSGETADTLAALQKAKLAGMQTLAIVNVETSSMARQADMVLPIYAGFEIGVASTKAFTAQLMVLALLTLYLMDDTASKMHMLHLQQAPERLSYGLERSADIMPCLPSVACWPHAIYLGRGIGYPLALEGALKLKEITYIHASAYPSGELKHGPIALVEEGTPVIVMAPFDALFDKLLSNVQEVSARGARIILASCHQGSSRMALHRVPSWHFVETAPHVSPFCMPFDFAPFLQLLAYHAAAYKGTDVDQPRNLAKSVTVE